MNLDLNGAAEQDIDDFMPSSPRMALSGIDAGMNFLDTETPLIGFQKNSNFLEGLSPTHV